MIIILLCVLGIRPLLLIPCLSAKILIFLAHFIGIAHFGGRCLKVTQRLGFKCDLGVFERGAKLAIPELRLSIP